MFTDLRKNAAVPILGEGTHKSKNAQPFTVDMLKRGNFDAVRLFVQALRTITDDSIQVCKSFREQMNSILLTNIESLVPFLRESREIDSSLTLDSNTVNIMTQFYQNFSHAHMQMKKFFEQAKQNTVNLMLASNTTLGGAEPNTIALSNSGEELKSEIKEYNLPTFPNLRSVF